MKNSVAGIGYLLLLVLGIGLLMGCQNMNTEESALKSVAFSRRDCPPLTYIATSTLDTEPLTVLERSNLESFARLFGAVRYFYPTESLTKAQWEAFARFGVQQVQSAPDATALVHRLRALFCPVAPAVAIFTADTPLLAPAVLTDTARGATEVIMWEHTGWGFESQNSNYSSVYTYGSLNNGDIPVGFHNPRLPYQADIGNGLTALVPLGLYVKDDLILPQSPPKSLRLLTSRLADLPLPTSTERITRLSDIILIWGTMQHFYPHFDVANTNWDAVLSKALQEATVAEDEMAYWMVLERMMAHLNDSHSIDIGLRPEFRANVARASLDLAWIEAQVLVTEVYSDGTDIQPGDVVVEMDGRPMDEVIAEMEARTSGATDAFRRRAALQKSLTGLYGSTVELTLRSATNREYTVTLTRTLSNNSWYERAFTLHEEWEPVYEVVPGIYYLSMSRLTVAAVRSLQAQEETINGLIIDLREYPTNKVPTTTELTLMPERMLGPELITPVIRFPNQERWEYPAPQRYFEGGTPLQVPKVYLVDDRSVSQSEHWASLIESAQGEDVGYPVVGGRTAGSNGEIAYYWLPSGFGIAWTGKKAYRQDGVDFQGNGVLPTHPVSPTRQGIIEGRDELLEYAIELLQNE